MKPGEQFKKLLQIDRAICKTKYKYNRLKTIKEISHALEQRES